ncbi:HupE/UreJ family protein [Planctomycetes bacterium TBK1r]|uniref:HupE/UreJ family protein n=1 Tax=Stieleria magnilauensis TaxID=2527963 RepID=UPI0011AA2606
MPSFRQAFLNIVKIVTLFTVAHSITLSLAALGVIDLPSRWVESLIALSIVLVAIKSMRRVGIHIFALFLERLSWRAAVVLPS